MVQTTATTITHTGNGSTTAFAFPYSYHSSADLDVSIDGTAKVLGTDYTVSSAGPASSCTITFTTAPAASAAILIARTTAQTQLTDYTNNDAFPAESHENALDKLQMQIQELQTEVDGVELGSGGIYFTAQSTPNGYVTAARPAVCYTATGGVWLMLVATENNDQWYQIIG